MTVQSHVAVRTAADHQLALVVTSRAADQRIGFQYAKRVDDLAQAGRDVNRLVLFEVVEDPVEVLTDPGRQLDARQDRTSVVLGKSVSVRVDLGVSRNHKNKNNISYS